MVEGFVALYAPYGDQLSMAEGGISERELRREHVEMMLEGMEDTPGWARVFLSGFACGVRAARPRVNHCPVRHRPGPRSRRRGRPAGAAQAFFPASAALGSAHCLPASHASGLWGDTSNTYCSEGHNRGTTIGKLTSDRGGSVSGRTCSSRRCASLPGLRYTRSKAFRGCASRGPPAVRSLRTAAWHSAPAAGRRSP